MRIALVIENMNLARGGRERSVAEIAAELARRGHDVTILCQEGTAPASVQVLPLGFAVRGRPAKFAEAVRDVVQREKYDIIHATLPVPAANVYQPRGGTIPGQISGKTRRLCPLGRIIRQASLLFNSKRQCELRMEKQIVADTSVMCLGVSQMVVEEFATHYNRRQNVRLVYSGVDIPQVDDATREAWRTQWRQKWDVGEKDIVFLTVANNFALKGIDEAIKALAGFSSTEARLVIVGSGKTNRYRQLARRCGVGGAVVFEQAVENIFGLYSAADAVVLLSWQDACSRVILEAIRWSLPSLTTRFNGAAELLARGAGVVVESPRDLPGIIAGMEKLSDHNKHLEMSNACQNTSDFASNTRQVDELEKVYKEIAG
ncbi:MAG: glycosyltransferase family 4 protein [Phycisphaerae bacterium]|nr:glycosyltransferase family 4 protein [Phycisphaerae bacterium]